MEKNRTRVHVLGEDFLIRTDKSDEYVKKVLELLKGKIEKIREMAGVQDNLRIAILAGLLLAEEIMEEKNSTVKSRPENEQEEEIGAIASRLISDLDNLNLLS
ncbi:MAG: cell division protein ZapA [Spirochaetales bacterium]|nr:cell division protein ZapA [Spirochaetales bacterium]